MIPKRKPYRHGDVLLVPVDEIPRDFVPKRDNKLAEGEKTGHYHGVVDGEVLERGGELMLRAFENTKLYHQEHSPDPETYPVAEGFYRVLIQREYDDEQEWRQVAD